MSKLSVFLLVLMLLVGMGSSQFKESSGASTDVSVSVDRTLGNWIELQIDNFVGGLVDALPLVGVSDDGSGVNQSGDSVVFS